MFSVMAPLVRRWRQSIVGVVCVGWTAGCVGRNEPPDASFLVVAGDSTFWVQSAGGHVRVRGSPLFLSYVDNRFSELYVTDDDRSYYDAVIVGQRVYRRDLVNGDSALVSEDSTIAAIARAWASAHPDDTPLSADAEPAEEPSTVATTETELLDVIGPYLSVEYHLDVDIAGDREEHLTWRGVIDVRNGRRLRVEHLVGDSAAARIYSAGVRSFAAAVDSVRAARDERAERARSAIMGFAFDSASFELLDGDDAPAIAFLVPGRGAQAGGYALPLPAIPLSAASWWQAVAPTRPTSLSANNMVWAGTGYDVVVRPDSTNDGAMLSLARGDVSWTVTRLPRPVRRVHRLTLPNDSTNARALAQAFDDAADYTGTARTASLARPGSRPAVRRSASGPRRVSSFFFRSTWNPRLRAHPKPL